MVDHTDHLITQVTVQIYENCLFNYTFYYILQHFLLNFELLILLNFPLNLLLSETSTLNVGADARLEHAGHGGPRPATLNLGLTQ